MDSYEINKDTYAVLSINDNITKIVEKGDEYFINKNCYEVMEDSCQYYGSSYEGRINGTKKILGSGYKVPIVVEESNDIIFFPTEAITSNSCTWIAVNHVQKYERDNGFTKITFDSGQQMQVKMSISSFETQLLRANRLSAILNRRRMG